MPKTNSKWDGVPQTVKEREKYHEKSKRYSSGGLHRTTGSAESSRSDTRLHSSRKREGRGGASSHSRGSSSSNLADLYGWEVGSHYSEGSIKEKDMAAEGSRASSAGTAFSYHALTLEHDSSFPPHDIPLAPNIVRTGTDAPPSSISGAPSLPEPSYSPTKTPCEPSPVTSDAPQPPRGHASPQAEANADDYFKTTVLEAPVFGDKVIVKSAGANILGAPATAKRRPKLAPDYYDGAGGKLETLNLQLNPIPKKERTPAKETPSPRPAKATGKLTTPARGDSRQKGLGIAVNLKNQGHAPSLTPRKSPESSNEERIITPTPESGKFSEEKKSDELVCHLMPGIDMDHMNRSTSSSHALSPISACSICR